MKKIIIEENSKNFLISEKKPDFNQNLELFKLLPPLSIELEKWEKWRWWLFSRRRKFPAFLVKTLFLILSLCSLIFLLTKCRKRQRVEEQENMWNWKIKPKERERVNEWESKNFFLSFCIFLTTDRSIRKINFEQSRKIEYD